MLNLFRKSQSESLTIQLARETLTGIQFTAPSDRLISSRIRSQSADRSISSTGTVACCSRSYSIMVKQNCQARGSYFPSDEVCRLNSVEQELLGLPEPYPFDLEIRSFGTFNEPEFRYNYQFLKPDRKSSASRADRLHIAFDARMGISPHARTVCPFGGIGYV